jgi:flavodoxin
MLALKTLVIYYSQNGITKAVAEMVAKDLGADLEQITDTESRSGIWGFLKSGHQAMSGKSAKIGAITSKIEDYDLVVIGTPIWAGRTSSPVNAFLSGFGDKIRGYAVIMTRGNPKNDYAPVTEIFAGKCKKAALAFVSLSASSVKNNDFSAAHQFASTLKGLDTSKSL